MNQHQDLEEALLELQKRVIGEEPDGEYQHGFRDGIQHAISTARSKSDDE